MSEDADESSKTEEPTGKKLEKAHEEGQYPMSQEVPIWMSIGGILIIAVSLLPRIVAETQRRLSFYLEHAHDTPLDQGGVGEILLRVVGDMLRPLWLPVLLLCMAGVLATVLQKGFTVSWALITPKFDKLNPLAGLQRMFSLGSQGVQLAKGLAKIAVVGGIAYMALMPMFGSIEQFIGIEAAMILAKMDSLLVRLLTGVFMIVMLIAGGDLVWQRFQYNKKMRMTKQEVKDESKQAEGDPQVKARIRQLRFEKARKRMMAAVPSADVVVTNPTHFAVALKYDPGAMGAPTVVAKGADTLALKIREIAVANDVPVVENPPLARALYATVEIDQEIPTEHYRAVAEVVTYVMKLRRKSARG